MKHPPTQLALLLASPSVSTIKAQEKFGATGFSSPTQMTAEQQGVVEVHFNRLPTSKRFNAPAYPWVVTENREVTWWTILIQTGIQGTGQHCAA